MKKRTIDVDSSELCEFCKQEILNREDVCTASFMCEGSWCSDAEQRYIEEELEENSDEVELNIL